MGSRRVGQEVRVLGLPRSDPRRQRPMRRCGRPGHGVDGDSILRGRCGRRRDGWLRPGLWTIDDVGLLHRQRREPMLPSGCQVRQWRVHPSPPDGHSRGRQAASDERIGTGRRGPRLGAAQTQRHPRSETNPCIGTLLLPRRALSEVREPRATRYRHPRDLQHLRQRRPFGRSDPHVRLPRLDPHPTP